MKQITAQHTPGPWNLLKGAWNGDHDSGSIGSIIGGKYEYYIATIEDAGDEEVQEENARLIAAAPELLKALKSLVDSCFQVSGLCQPTQRAIDAARVAIAAATQQ